VSPVAGAASGVDNSDIVVILDLAALLSAARTAKTVTATASKAQIRSGQTATRRLVVTIMANTSLAIGKRNKCCESITTKLDDLYDTP
jgi:hypothetical protein